MIIAGVVIAVISISLIIFAIICNRKIKAVKEGESDSKTERWENGRLVGFLLGTLIAVFGIIFLLFLFWFTSLFKSCNSEPEKYGAPIDGLWFYEGNSKMKSDGSERQLLVNKIELNGEVYDLRLGDEYSLAEENCIAKGDTIYFCAKVYENREYISALFSYRVSDENYKQICVMKSDVKLIDVDEEKELMLIYRDYGYYVVNFDGFTTLLPIDGGESCRKVIVDKYLCNISSHSVRIRGWKDVLKAENYLEFDYYKYDGFEFTDGTNINVYGHSEGILITVEYSSGETGVLYYENGSLTEVFKTENGYKINFIYSDGYDIEEKYLVYYEKYNYYENSYVARNCSVLRIKGDNAESIYTFVNKNVDYTSARYVEGYINFSPKSYGKSKDEYYIKNETDMMLKVDDLTFKKGQHKDDDINIFYENDDFVFRYEYERKFWSRNRTIIKRKNKRTNETETMQYRTAYHIIYIG